VVNELAGLQGLVPDAVGRVLAGYAMSVPADQVIVEVGSYKGKSTAYLAYGAKNGNGAHVFAVDAWDTPGNTTGRFGYAEPSTREQFESQLRSARLWSRVTALQGFSTDIAARWHGRKIGMLFIDGDHHETNVRADFHAWEPHLADGAIVVFDDLDTPKNPGVRVVIDELADTFATHVEAERLAVGIYRR
jgi:predicted O-methyltransferase YrrM